MSESTFPLALMGGTPIRPADKPWPAWPQFDESDRNALLETFDSGNWWYGDRVAQFEREYAEFQGAKCCVTCSNGTVALELCVQAAGIGPGDEVIVPPFTFFATASAVSRLGGTPVFVDVDESWNMDVTKIEEAITENTRAIIPVHFAGVMVDMDRIMEIAEKHNLFVIEDACHSWGSKWKGEGAGTLGDCGVFSFQASKNLTAGEGGAMVTNDGELAALLQSLTHCGRIATASQLEYYNMGTNARIPEMQAALLSSQLKRMPEQNALRVKNGEFLNEALSKIDGLTMQPIDPRQTERSWHIYCLRIDPDVFGCSRDRAVEALNAEGLQIGGGYPMPVYKQPVYVEQGGFEDVSCPVCEDLCYRTAMWFRHSMLLGSDADMQDIVAIFEKVKAHASDLT